MNYRLLFTCFYLAFAIGRCALANGQSNQNAPANSRSNMEIENLRNIEQSYKGKKTHNAADEYERLAASMADQKKYDQSNAYYQKALAIYKEKKDAPKQAYVLRKIAINDELLNNKQDAKLNYFNSNRITEDPNLKELNKLDINRIDNSGNNEIEEKILTQKIGTLSKGNNDKEEITQARIQLADVALNSNKPDKAISALQKAETETSEQFKKVLLSDKVATIYADLDSFAAAIELTEKNLNAAIEQNDQELYYELVPKLGNYYYESGQTNKSIDFLKMELNKAYKNLNTNGIININKILTTLLIKQGKQMEATQLFQQLNDSLPYVIDNDSLLFSKKLFSEIDQRLQILEQEKAAQTALYKKTNNYNVILLVSLLLTIGILISIFWSIRKLKTKNLQILLQALRREMNPHFLFNALNSVNQFIATNNERAANKYLSQYATLMRTFMNNSNKDFIRLKEEIDTIEHYLSLEHLRFEHIFDYKIHLADDIDAHNIFIPNMLLQPFVENAIWHGLRYKAEKGKLNISFSIENNNLQVLIEDNGIGIKESKLLKTKHQQTYQSRGMQNIGERIKTLNKIYHANISLTVIDLTNDNQSGTIIKLNWNNKQYYVEQ